MDNQIIKSFRERARNAGYTAYIRKKPWQTQYHVELVDHVSFDSVNSFDATEETLDTMLRIYERRNNEKKT